MTTEMTVYDFEAKTIDGKTVSMREYQGKTLLIVNTASKCGFTPQYKGLQALYERYKDRGFVVLGFPCDQFASQEPGTETQIKKFCEMNYRITFPMFAKIEVNGDGAHPLYAFLKRSAKGLLGTEAIKWNFTKFLVDKTGKVLDRYAPNTEPESIAPELEKLLER